MSTVKQLRAQGLTDEEISIALDDRTDEEIYAQAVANIEAKGSGFAAQWLSELRYPLPLAVYERLCLTYGINR